MNSSHLFDGVGICGTGIGVDFGLTFGVYVEDDGGRIEAGLVFEDFADFGETMGWEEAGVLSRSFLVDFGVTINAD